ncbi:MULTISPECIES: MurR/RpiR family transcriptional regulator [Rhodanobacter]|jgi:DNA-binding MurR/RpiR family transcriptional regulator|uniref:DNA-binding transcriptional regulator, MurR/RpiR family, contains HTH and SIS domains n=1 Tax=Rhodanobacter glycinis TaxID=582702 RepID=A0A1I3ZTL0_9GAMM|nr:MULTISPECIES: MurR/RpiR family transcriptional regulator [Rhodanobacter]EIL96319.1 RpiR family transcriptional regulator [Rhodanobacter sp. 115]SFK47230.1 DNA-binding transcriptional regulator, MurR/RpiR family, contains HTH and SIS domains [Rhodanobacter glycinis]
MSPLVKIRSERDQMSAVERRIADFILDNAQLLRDYSSQQLANALGISQSSVVKFTQKLGFKGYPDLKYSVGEAIARADNGGVEQATAHAGGETDDSSAGGLWRRKSEAEEATRLINTSQTLAAVAGAIGTAGRSGKVFIIGLGDDDIYARGFALKLSLLGILTVHNFDTARMTANVSAASAGDVLLVFSEHGNHPALCKISRYFRERRGQVISVTRHTANPLRTLADIALLVSAHDEQPYIQPLLYQSALQHLLDGIFVRLCESDDSRHAQLVANLDRIQQMLEP